MAQTQILASWMYIPLNNLFKCQLQFSKNLSCLWILNICNKYLFWECFTFMTLDLLLYAPQNLSFKYHASRKSDHSSSSHLHGPISNISSGLHKVIGYRSFSATSIISCNLLLLKHFSWNIWPQNLTLPLEKYLAFGRWCAYICVYACMHTEWTTECKYMLYEWHT